MTPLKNVMLCCVPLALTLAPIVVVEGARKSVHGGGIPPRPSSTRSGINHFRRLHDILAIGDDPNEDIRTNILLNMEGI